MFDSYPETSKKGNMVITSQKNEFAISTTYLQIFSGGYMVDVISINVILITLF